MVQSVLLLLLFVMTFREQFIVMTFIQGTLHKFRPSSVLFFVFRITYLHGTM